MFYLIRHGETDNSENGTKIYQGYGKNFNPLTMIIMGFIRKEQKSCGKTIFFCEIVCIKHLINTWSMIR